MTIGIHFMRGYSGFLTSLLSLLEFIIFALLKPFDWPINNLTFVFVHLNAA